MNRYFRVALVATLSAAAVCGGDFLPLAQGNTWTYRESASGQTFTVRVGTPVAMQSGRVYHALTGYVDRQLLVRNDENQQLMYLDEDSGQERFLTSFLADGHIWAAPHRNCTNQGHTQNRRIPYTGPAGSWERTLEIRYMGQCADAGLESESYAENIGMVRRVAQTIAGPRVFELLHARVGTVIVEGGDRGRFTLSAVQNPLQRLWRVTLRVDMGLAPGLNVRFPSSQDYDVILRDKTGKSVFTWSADKAFLQMERIVNISSGWSATVDVPFPVGSTDLQYSLEAFLTTSPDQPKFAAATTVMVPEVTIGLQ